MTQPPRLCIVQKSADNVSETFLRAHAERLPNVVGVVYREDGVEKLSGQPLAANHALHRLWRHFERSRSDGRARETERMYGEAFRRCRAEVVLAEYGVIGVRVIRPCADAGIPFVVHFHGYDASHRKVLARYGDEYRTMFDKAAAVVVVSRAMERQLVSLGCSPAKIAYNPCGVDTDAFSGGAPADAPPHFVAVGRLVNKKAPHLTILAFSRVLSDCPDARLTVIGHGELFDVCRDLIAALGIERSVELLGAQPHERVQATVRGARAFVQHSVVTVDGDSEGTPVAVLEAGAAGLPVIATAHAGIADVVVDGETGLLCQERDVDQMAAHMRMLARDAAFAAALGRKAAQRIRAHYTMTHSARRLASVIAAAASGRSMTSIRDALNEELPGTTVPVEQHS